MRTNILLVFAGLVLTVRPAFAQEKPKSPARSVYKVEFTIRDGSQGAAARQYAILVATDGRSVFRLGNKVPYVTGNAQYNYADIGVNIDCRLREAAPRVAVDANIELTSVLHADKGASGVAPNPTIAQTRIEVSTDLEPGKPAVLGTVDDPATQRKLNVEAVATKVL